MTDLLNQSQRTIEEVNSPSVEYFQVAYQTFQVAVHTVASIEEHFYNIGGYVVCLRFAGSALVRLITPALAHLATTPDSIPALTINCWDSASTRVMMPPPAWQETDHLVHGEIRGYSSDRIRTVFNQDSQVLSMLDTAMNVGVYWVRDAEFLPYYEIAAPLRIILHWWMSLHHRQFAHAAALGTEAGGVLLVGKGGAGKSTSALACLNSHLKYASDDYCLLATDSVPYVYSLYNSAKLNADSVKRLPHLAPLIYNSERLNLEKAVLLLHQKLPEKVVSGFPLKAILMPRVTGLVETKLKLTTAAAALIALAPSTLFQLPGADAKSFQHMAKLVQQIPCYVLELGTDIAAIPQVICNFLLEI